MILPIPRLYAFLLAFLWAGISLTSVKAQGSAEVAYEKKPEGPKLPDFLQYLNDPWVDSLMQVLTPKERIAQLFMISAYSNQGAWHPKAVEEIVSQHGVGGVLFFQGGPMRQVDLYNRLQAKSRVPMITAIDGEWGLAMRLDSTMSFPYQMTLGAIQDDSLVREMGKAVGEQCRATGVHINFAPVADVNNNPNNPVISFRSFGESREIVAEKAGAYALGMESVGVISNAKHFPGHGDTDVDSHKDLPLIPHDMQRLDSIELYPFKHLIKKGASSMMVAHISVPSLDDTPHLPTTLSKPVVTDLLKDSLGFEGLIFTDALDMRGVTKYFPVGEADIRAIKAGNDMLLFRANIPSAIFTIQKSLKSRGGGALTAKEQGWVNSANATVPRVIGLIEQAVQNGRLSQAEIDMHCRKILAAKRWVGLHKSNASRIEPKTVSDAINKPEHKQLIRELTKNALTVVRNEPNTIPIKNLKTTKLLSISIGKTRRTKFQQTLSKYATVKHLNISAKPSDAQVAMIKRELKNHDIAIVGIHQVRGVPYNYKVYNSQAKLLLSTLASSGKAILCSFRNPYTLEEIDYIEKSRGLVLAYQDSPDAQELMAQLLFGGIGASGRLPVSIGNKFSVGEGIDTKGSQRLEYTTPEDMGMDSRFLKQQIDSIAYLALREGVSPGLQVLAAKDGKVFFHQSYGHHTYERKRAVKNDDIFDLASITKVAGSTLALMKLYDEGQIQLDTPFSEYYTSWQRGNKKKLTLKAILSHHAQLQAWFPYWEKVVNKQGEYRPGYVRALEQPEGEFSVKLGEGLYLNRFFDMLIREKIRKSKLLPKKKGYVYSGLSFYIYPELIREKTGFRFDTYLENTFYDALGANTMGFNPYKNYDLERILPTEVDTFFRKRLIHGYVHDEGAIMMGGISGNAGLFGTANDLAKVMQLFLNKGVYGGERYFSASTMDAFNHRYFEDKGNRRGLGFDKVPLKNKENGTPAPSASEQSFGHSGYTGTFTWADPENGLLFIFMSNRVHPTRYNGKIYKFNIRPAMHQVFYDALNMQ